MVQFDPASFPEGSGWTYTDYQVGGGGGSAGAMPRTRIRGGPTIPCAKTTGKPASAPTAGSVSLPATIASNGGATTIGGTTMLTGSATSWMASWQRQLGLHRGAVPQWYFGCYNYAARCYYQTGRPSDDYSTSLCLDGYFQTGSARPLGAAE